MLPRRPTLCRVARPPTAPRSRPRWRQAPARCYAVDSASSDAVPAWFPPLRAEMLARETTYFLEDIVAEPERRLANTLAGFLPPLWCQPATADRPIVTPGHHLIWFNPALPADRMLPDGTDASHSPGPPWVRRMWAGGSVAIQPELYFHRKDGFVVGGSVAGVERIKDVRLRGHGEAAKLFVTIERRFAQLDHLYTAHKRKNPGGATTSRRTVEAYFKQQLRDDEGWGDAMLTEERELVFLRERSAAELDAPTAPHMAPVRYLDRE